MELFDVYSLFDVTPVRAKGCRIWDDKGQEYLDLYGGHAVISVGHSHPRYVEALKDQLDRIGFYSNSVKNPLQEQLAHELGEASGYPDYSLFLDNSGAESNENALKLASFHTGKDRIIAFHRSFHGRTSGAVAVTDNPRIVSPFNANHKVTFCHLNDAAGVEKELAKGDVAGVIIEGIQGCGGIHVPSDDFMVELEALCHRYGALLLLDEVQSGCGILIAPHIQASKGMLGTTFGGNYLAMAAALAVLAIIRDEDLIGNAFRVGEFLKASIPASPLIREVRGRGLMLGMEFNCPIADIRRKLLFEKHIFTGVAGSDMIRLLAPLCLSQAEAGEFITALKEVL